MAAPPLIGSIHVGSMMLNQGSRLGYTVAMEYDQSYTEVEAMLAERVKEWTEEWKRQGLQEGIQQGLQQGL